METSDPLLVPEPGADFGAIVRRSSPGGAVAFTSEARKLRRRLCSAGVLCAEDRRTASLRRRVGWGDWRCKYDQ